LLRLGSIRQRPSRIRLMGSAREDIRARLIFFFFLSLSLGIPHAALKLPGFKNPTTEIPTPPSDHIPLRRCCAFGARKREDRLSWRPLV
jgi:hypothetical protein